MKLHTLDIQAFGPFANKEHIDFNVLGDSPLFLIDGPTGAGKSSILHAICYALYGETTDEARKEIGLRCDHANDDTLTRLTLEFSIAKQHYRICRTPTQMRKQKRGDGVTEQKSEVHLMKILDDGTIQTIVAKKKKEADQQIVNIIGLSAEQFRQVMVLPQGKFRELLLAKSDARQAIFSTLFQTEIYKYIEQILKDKAASIEREYKRFEERISEALQEVNVSDVEQLSVLISAAKEDLQRLTKQKAESDTTKQLAIEQWQQGKKINDLYNQQKIKKTALDVHLGEATLITEKIKQLDAAHKAKGIEHIFVSLLQLRNDISMQNNQHRSISVEQHSVQQKLIGSEQDLKLALQQYTVRDSLLTEIEQLKHYSTLQQELAQQQQQATKVLSNELKAKQSLEQFQIKQQEIIDRSIKGEKYVADLEAQIEQKTQLELQLNQQQHILQTLKQKQLIDQELANQQINFHHQQLQQVSLQTAYLSTEQQANSLEMQWFSNQASVLAQNLQPNVPCQVCGSTVHPFPAHRESEQGVITKDSVDAIRAVQKKSHNALIQHNKTLVQTEESIRITSLQLDEIVTQIKEYKNLQVPDVELKIKQLNQQLSDIENVQKSLIKGRALLEQLQCEISPVAEKITKLQQQLPVLIEATIVIQTSVDSLQGSLPEEYRQPLVISQTLQKKQKQMTELEQRLKEAQNKNSKFETKLGALNSQLLQLTSSIDHLSTRLQGQETVWQDKLVSNGFDSMADYKKANIEQLLVEQIHQQVENYKEKSAQLTSQLQLLAEQLKGKTQPELDVLEHDVTVQQRLFDQVEQQWAKQQSQLYKLEGVNLKINALEIEQGENKQQYQVVGTLAKAASGKGNVRVSLERFVLADLLDSVLSIASKRLHIMSKGQYQLVRQNEDLQKKNVTAGLDLAIDDAYTGKTRPVATLSGGESFLASLALALGLSDVVQQRSGGIQMDTLFIDEGFGSLDQESLQLAIQTLIDLQASGRTIGIISHVSELKEQMALRIDVKQSNSGSSIETICDY